MLYNSYVEYFRSRFGERLQKLVLDVGFSCPNRDGTVGVGGCTYCDNAAFHPAYSSPDKPLYRQIDEGIGFHRGRYRNVTHYLAYFQSFSNTYAPLERLKELYETALSHPAIVGIAIGTRPDCIDKEKLEYLSDLKDGKVLEGWHRDGFERPVVIIEYGIESCYDRTLERINRGHDFETARNAVVLTAGYGIEDIGAHFIFGLPGETRQMMLDECRLIDGLPLRSVKFHQLQMIKGTRMAQEFKDRPDDFVRMGLDEYLDFIVDVLERLRPDLYVERIAGEVPPRFLDEMQWGRIRNVEILRMLDKKLISRNTFQGKLFKKE